MRTLTQPLNMSPGGIPPVIHVSQYDSDFTIVFALFSTVGDFTIESGTTAMVRGTKSSGTGYSADATINISAKTVTVTGNAQMTVAAGQNIFEVVLKKNNKEISSKNFILNVERAALDADTITDESVLKELNAIIEGAETATQAAEEAGDAADRAEAAAQTLVIDSIPTQGSTNAVSSGGVYDALGNVDVDAITDEVKQALLACFQHVAWIDGHGQNYYDALESALYAGTDVDIPVVFWDYSLGRVPSNADGITTETTGSKTITFDQNRGVYITGGSGESENIRFIPTEYPTCKKAYFESVFTITDIENTGSYAIRLSNGINGVNYVVGMVYENNVLVFRLMYKTGDNDTIVVIPQFIPEFNTEYKIRIEYEDGGTNKVYINDALIHETQDIATKWATENRAMAIGGVSVYIKSMKWGIEKEAYKVWNYPSDTALHSVLGFSSDNSDIYSANDHRSLYVDDGKANTQLLYTNGNLINNGSAFMIPIPSDATKAAVTISQSWMVAFSVWNYSNGRNSRAWVVGANGWNTGTKTITFTAQENLALGLSYKLQSGADITAQDVGAISIVFG